VLLTTQAALFVHLILEEDHGEYNSHDCPVCQQLFSLANNPAVEENIEINNVPHYEAGMVFQTSVVLTALAFHVSGPRAPPAVS
jgi:hypothetical protein